MEIVTITTEFIKLQDLLKLADAVSTGGEAKIDFRQRRLQQQCPGKHRTSAYPGCFISWSIIGWSC